MYSFTSSCTPAHSPVLLYNFCPLDPPLKLAISSGSVLKITAVRTESLFQSSCAVVFPISLNLLQKLYSYSVLTNTIVKVSSIQFPVLTTKLYIVSYSIFFSQFHRFREEFSKIRNFIYRNAFFEDHLRFWVKICNNFSKRNQFEIHIFFITMHL